MLDGNGNGYSTNDAVDWRVVLTTNAVPGAGVGHEGVTSYSAPGLGYGVERWGGEVLRVQLSVIRGEITITNTLAGYIHDLEGAAPSVPSTWTPLTSSVATGPIHTLAVPMTNDAQWFRVWTR